jgi:hypothetical protein
LKANGLYPVPKDKQKTKDWREMTQEESVKEGRKEELSGSGHLELYT